MKKEKTNKNGLYYLLSFLFPFAIILISFFINHMEPFGENNVLNGDAEAQYYPFLIMLRQTVREGGSLLYTWKAGLGMSLIPMIAYYISSPLNLISILLPEDWIRVWLMLAVCIRYGLAGFSFTVLAHTVKPKLTVNAVVFGTVFALCGWMLTSYWQIIWLGTVGMTPLVLAGLIRAVRDRDYRLYPAALTLSLICNFYMGFITCMMTGFCWIGLMVILKKKWREIPKEAGSFLGLSVLSAAVGAVLFIPVLYTITDAARASSGTISFTLFYETLPELFGQFSSLTFPVINRHPPALQSSMLVLMFPLPFLTAKRISLRERIFCFAMACFLVFSLWYEPLNIMWHGFHFPGGTVDRFAYLVPLTLAYIGWRYTESMAEEREPFRNQIAQLLLMIPLPVLVLICAAKVQSTDIPLVCAVYCVLYAAAYMFRMNRPQKTEWFVIGLVLVSGFEMFLNTYSFVMRKIGRPFYVYQDEYVQKAAEQIREKIDSLSLSRTGVSSQNPYGNGELLYHLPYGSSSFNSLNKSEVQKLCVPMGLVYAEDEKLNVSCSYSYQSLSPFASLLLNIPYAISDDPVPYFHCISEDFDMPAVSSDEDEEETKVAAAYESDFRMYPGFCIAKDAAADDPKAFQLMDAQNRIFQELTGMEQPYAKKYVPEITETSDVAVEDRKGFCHVTAEKMLDEKNPPHANVKYRFRPEKSGVWFCAVHYNSLEQSEDNKAETSGIVLVKATVNGEKTMLHQYGYTIPVDRIAETMGYVEAGQEIEVTMGFFAGTESEYVLELYQIDEDVFKRGYEILTRNPFTVTEFADSRLTGTVHADEDSLLYLSIPYDKGWKAEVDGAPAEIQPVLDAMTGIPLKAGDHTVKLRFIPRGLIAGVIVSTGALAGYIWLIVMQNRRRKGEKVKETAHADA